MNYLITGASSGIGEALALRCAAEHANLFLCARDSARLEEVAAHCREKGAAMVCTRILDVTDAEAMARWIRQCDATTALDMVFANAGVATGEETNENVRRTFAINIGGVVNTVLPAIEAFRARQAKNVHIIITASIAGYGPLKSCPAYSATKACVKTWALALRGMLAQESIQVSAVCPGFVRSRITDQNDFPMPFFLEADQAAQLILRRAKRNVGLIAFPWPMRLASWGLSILPYRLNELINRLLPAKRRK